MENKKRRLTEDEKKSILLEYKLNNSNDHLKAICKKYNITRQSIWNISKDEKIQNDYSIKEWQANFTKKANLILDALLDRMYKQALDNNDKTQFSQLATSFGIIYDKLRLNENLSTSNNSVSINIKID